MKPKIYNLYFSDYDGNSEYGFTHPDNKLRSEFEQDVQDLAIKYMDEHIDAGGSVGGDPWDKCWIGHDTIVKMIASKLPVLGYVPFSETFETISFGIGGSIIIDSLEDGNPLLMLTNLETVQKVVDYNVKYAEEN